MEMRQLRLEIILEALTPIAHHEQTIGNASLFMGRKVRLRDGSFVRVPQLNADALRHQLREAIAYATLDAAGLLHQLRERVAPPTRDAAGIVADGGPCLTEAAARLLFNGGMLTGRGDASAVRLAEWRSLMDALPHLALFGGCVNSQMIPGQIQVGDGMLVCEENRHLVPTWVLDWCAAQGSALDTCRAHLDEEMRVRMDPSRDPAKRRLLAPAARDALERRLAASERAHDEDDAAAREATKSTMLPRTAEVLVPGSLFSWDVTATVYSDLELDALHTALAAFLANASVGGKSGTGHGRLRGVVANRVELARPKVAYEAVDLGALAPRMGETFRAHVQAHADKVRAVLAAVDA